MPRRPCPICKRQRLCRETARHRSVPPDQRPVLRHRHPRNRLLAFQHGREGCRCRRCGAQIHRKRTSPLPHHDGRLGPRPAPLLRARKVVIVQNPFGQQEYGRDATRRPGQYGNPGPPGSSRLRAPLRRRRPPHPRPRPRRSRSRLLERIGKQALPSARCGRPALGPQAHRPRIRRDFDPQVPLPAAARPPPAMHRPRPDATALRNPQPAAGARIRLPGVPGKHALRLLQHGYADLRCHSRERDDGRLQRCFSEPPPGVSHRQHRQDGRQRRRAQRNTRRAKRILSPHRNQGSPACPPQRPGG